MRRNTSLAFNYFAVRIGVSGRLSTGPLSFADIPMFRGWRRGSKYCLPAGKTAVGKASLQTCIARNSAAILDDTGYFDPARQVERLRVGHFNREPAFRECHRVEQRIPHCQRSVDTRGAARRIERTAGGFGEDSHCRAIWGGACAQKRDATGAAFAGHGEDYRTLRGCVAGPSLPIGPVTGGAWCVHPCGRGRGWSGRLGTFSGL